MAAVAAEERPPAFKKPIPCKPPLTEWDAKYWERKKSLVEKRFTCKSRRAFCYYTDGAADPSKEDVPVVLCLHGASQAKEAWILPEPFENIFMVMPDRMGSGGSSSTPEAGFSFADGCSEFLELMDAVYADKHIPVQKKFFVTGHSMGGTWTV
eukprot:TRINITY_DN22651_c0_g1_i1.p2 TRINITY_DN22651_c0_g1~~TRINITY_DN22651_c0_g1_i1.p2  ORF type:complete len:153 (-),score=41.66 TRINITY_DN22651_c0_g1_i1:977-1435(-)